MWSSGLCELSIEPKPDSRLSNIEVHTVVEGQALPGVEITAEPSTKDGTTAVHAFTNASGVATLSLPNGNWIIRADLSGLKRLRCKLLVQSGNLYVIKMQMTLQPTEPVTVF